MVAYNCHLSSTKMAAEYAQGNNSGYAPSSGTLDYGTLTNQKGITPAKTSNLGPKPKDPTQAYAEQRAIADLAEQSGASREKVLSLREDAVNARKEAEVELQSYNRAERAERQAASLQLSQSLHDKYDKYEPGAEPGSNPLPPPNIRAGSYQAVVPGGSPTGINSRYAPFASGDIGRTGVNVGGSVGDDVKNVSVNTPDLTSDAPNFEMTTGQQVIAGQRFSGVDLFNPDNRNALTTGIQGGLYSTAGEALSGTTNPLFSPLYGESTNKGAVPFSIAPLNFTPTPAKDTATMKEHSDALGAISFFNNMKYFNPAGFVIKDKGLEQQYQELPGFLKNGERLNYTNPLGEKDIVAPSSGNPFVNFNNQLATTSFNVLRGAADIPKDFANTPLVEAKKLTIGAGVGVGLGVLSGGSLNAIAASGGVARAELFESAGTVALGALAGYSAETNPYGFGRSLPETTVGALTFGAGFQSMSGTKVVFSGVERGQLEPRLTDDGILGVGQGSVKASVVRYGVTGEAVDLPTVVTLEATPLARRNEYLADVKLQGGGTVDGQAVSFSEDFTGGLRVNAKSSRLALTTPEKDTVFLAGTTSVKQSGLDYVTPGEKSSFVGVIEGVNSKTAVFRENDAGVLESSTGGKSKMLVDPLSYNKQNALGVIRNERVDYSSNFGVTVSRPSGGASLEFANRGFRLLERTGRYNAPSIEFTPRGVGMLSSRKGQLSFGSGQEEMFSQSVPSFSRGNVLGNPATISLQGLPLREQGISNFRSPLLSLPGGLKNTFRSPVAQGTFRLPTAGLSYRQGLSNAQTPFRIPASSFDSGLISLSRVRQDITPSFDVVRIPAQVQGQEQVLRDPEPRGSGFGGFVGPGDVPPPPIVGGGFGLPTFGPPGFFTPSGRAKKRGFKYVPSLTAISFDIHGRQPRGPLTGIETRPLPLKGKGLML
jgi:hypothetical protein